MLKLTSIKKSYKTGDFVQTALDGVSIVFRDNEFAAVLGPSGSGKTTMLNIIGGLDRYDSGDLEIDGISTKKYKSSDWDTYRNNRIGFVFQSYNLIPHQTILANVELALTLSGVSSAERKEKAKQALDEVGLIEHIHKLPNQLSGGQMQRVAIARALINDPEILLADEPTGALDTKTSDQVMDLLTEIAKDRLVIMVTHNSELADKYANRLIHLRDGKVTYDSNPYNSDGAVKNGRESRKASMSYLTALSLSFSNLMTKKGRTFVTALAGSIGIIGIAAILALANGINAYIENIEQETMSIYPISIQSSGFDFSNIIGNAENDDKQADPGSVLERKVVESLFSNRRKNDLANMKKYFEENSSEINPYVHLIQYSYDVKPQIYLENSYTEVDRVSPDAILGAYGIGSSSGMGNIMSSFSGVSGGMEVFKEMPSKYSMFEYQYNLLAGHWPEKYDESILVLGPGGRITDFVLYTMGIRDRGELKALVEAFMNNEDGDLEIEQTDGQVSYEQLLAAQFKVINPASKYQYDKKYDVWVDKSSDKKFMKQVISDGLTLKIVGIVQPKDGVTATTLSQGINYTPDLITYLIGEAAKSEVVKDQMAHPTVNVLTGKTFIEENEDSNESKFSFTDLITVDEKAIQNAFKMDASKLQLDLSGLNNITFDFSNIKMPSFDTAEITAMLQAVAKSVNVPADQIIGIMKETMEAFLAEEKANGVNDIDQLITDFNAYIERTDVADAIKSKLTAVVDASSLQPDVVAALQQYLQGAMGMYVGQIMMSLQGQMQTQIQLVLQTALGKLPQQMQSAMSIDTKAFQNAFKMNMKEDDILNLMTSMMSTEESTYERNLSILGYANMDNPSQISIYPIDFNAKKATQDFIDNYNEKMKAAGENEKVVNYTDIVGVLMSSVTDIIDLISYALVAFVSISLVVSSIMIGVITYISVLERKKEIGILRAIGASKKNIRQVFNAETLIVGFVAGVIGILLTLVISFIANIIMYNLLGVVDISRLPLNAAIILIVVSMFLTFIAGLFPSSAAASKDPVEALRSE